MRHRLTLAAVVAASVLWTVSVVAQGSGSTVLTMLQVAGRFGAPLGPMCEISGQVLDAAGNVPPNVKVFAARLDVRGRRRVVSARTLGSMGREGEGAVVDSTGRYRLGGLEPVDYIVQAVSFATVTRNEARPYTALPPTFHPGTTEFESAAPIDLSTHCQTFGINVTMRAAPMVSISGVAVGPEGAPLARGSVSLMGVDGGPIVRGAPVHPDGTFRVPDVPNGRYRLRATPSAARGGPDLSATSTLDITVENGDLAGLVLRPEALIPVSGMVRIQSGSDRLAFQQARVLARLLDDALTPAPVQAAVREDGSFSMRVPRGRVIFDVSTSGSAQGWMADAIHLNGVDVLDGVSVDRPIDDLTIVLAESTQSVWGSVVDASGTATQEYVVLVFLQDAAKWLEPATRPVLRTFSDRRGEFKTSGLRRGDYYAIALHTTESRRWQDANFLAALAPLATAVKLPAAGQVRVDLRAICLSAAGC